MPRIQPLAALLMASGTIASGIGLALLVSPAEFQAGAGIALGTDPNLLSEVRASGGALVAMGTVMQAGAVFSRYAILSLVVAACVYLSYGLSRLVSLAVDGVPGEAILYATAVELVLGALALAALYRRREAL